ncbi:MAG: hypothetical protein M1335_04810 [Chloroflexi bacterium]|nr:hypothetical protein [Chloroflexota bacterium]
MIFILDRWRSPNRHITLIAVLMLGILPNAISAALRSAEQGPSGASGPQPSIVHRELTNILSDPEYNRFSGEPAKPSLMQKFWKKLWDLIARFFKWLGESLTLHGGSASRIASFIFACVIIIAFFALLTLIIKKLSNPKVRGSGSPEVRGGNYDLPSARPLIKEAARLAEEGDFRSAFRCAYLASISYLDDTAALRFERSRTNWEYLGELKRGGHETPYDALRPLTLDFDRKFYGCEECRREDYLNAVGVYNSIAGEAA